MLINKIPPVSEYLGQTRGMGAGIAAKGAFVPGQRDRLTDLLSSARVLVHPMDSAIAAPSIGMMPGLSHDCSSWFRRVINTARCF